MSQSIDTALVTQYKDNILLTAAQDDNRLMNTVDVDMDVTGESAYFERIGAAAFQTVTSRHGDSPQIEIAHSRRKADFVTYETGDQIDNPDRVRMLIDPTSSYVKRQAGALNRAIDDEIIAAASRAAVTGKAGGGTATIGASQTVEEDFSVASSGLLVEKVIEAKRILDANEVPPNDRYFVTNALGFSHLLQQDQVTSVDYNAIKALVMGEVDTFLGFKFIRSERLEFTSPDRTNLAFQSDAIKLGMPMNLTLHVDPARSDKRFNTYIMYEAVFGAVRMEEERMVLVQVDEVTAALV